MSEMVERVTRAIFEADGGTWPITDPTFRDLFDAYARAAIAAMREPDWAVLEAGALTLENCLMPDCGHCDVGEAYTAMIDAALKEPAGAEAPAE